MTTKVLIQTLTQVPDIELLNELFDIIKKTDSLIIPDIRKFFDMISALYQCKNQKVIRLTFDMNQHINRIMLNTQIQVSWQHIGKSLVKLCGEEHSEIRKRARNIILEIMKKSNNSFMILEKAFYQGLQDQSIIVMVYSIKLIFQVLQLTPNILAKKSCINIIKLILEKIIRLTNNHHIDLQKNANHFLHRLFFLKIQKMDEVLQRVDPFYLTSLQKIWQKNKQNLLYKQQQQQHSEWTVAIKYQHLPLINDHIFGVYEPFVIKNIFNPQTQAAKKYAIQMLKQKFFQNEQRLTKYLNSICKIIIKLLPQKYLDIIQLLHHIISLPGITNIVNINELSKIIIDQLDTQNVIYRRQIRDVLKKFNYLSISSEIIIKKYQQALENDGQAIEQWMKIYQILCLVQHWAQNADAVQCYPPTLDFVVKFTSINMNHKVIKVKDQCEKLLYFILEKFTGYRQNLDQYFDQKTVAHFEDILESKKAYRIPDDKKSKLSKETFQKEFQQERLKFLKSKKK